MSPGRGVVSPRSLRRGDEGGAVRPMARRQAEMRVLAGLGQPMRAKRSRSCGVWSAVRTASLKAARA